MEYYVTATAATGTEGGGQTGPFSAASNTVSTGTISAPTMEAVTILPGVASPSSVTAPTTTPPAFASGSGEAVVTYSEPVTCLSTAGSDFSYSNSGGTPSPIAGVSCSPAPSGDYNGATSDNAADTLIIGFAPYSTTTISGTTYYEANTVAAPANGDTFTYTAPSTPTTADAVYAGTTTSPSYAATQTLTSNGNNTLGQPLVTGLPSNDVISTAAPESGTGNASGDTVTFTSSGTSVTADYASNVANFATVANGQVTVLPYTIETVTPTGSSGSSALSTSSSTTLAVWNVNGNYYYVDLSNEAPGSGGSGYAWVGVGVTNSSGTVSMVYNGTSDGNTTATDYDYIPVASGTNGTASWTMEPANSFTVQVITSGSSGSIPPGTYNLTATTPGS